ncbi:hypothetical protein DSO57_1024135 [Entomophthora muscae]|uniref:Uncharacterized protein n=1 Tax=Entomophthora muscae TaxID=34485 RepID=A0ACC2TDR1_9FUNG|nr:hypothetical protein DSO57_1024135 [Entomophthora muscae]
MSSTPSYIQSLVHHPDNFSKELPLQSLKRLQNRELQVQPEPFIGKLGYIARQEVEDDMSGIKPPPLTPDPCQVDLINKPATDLFYNWITHQNPLNSMVRIQRL